MTPKINCGKHLEPHPVSRLKGRGPGNPGSDFTIDEEGTTESEKSIKQ